MRKNWFDYEVTPRPGFGRRYDVTYHEEQSGRTLHYEWSYEETAGKIIIVRRDPVTFTYRHVRGTSPQALEITTAVHRFEAAQARAA